MRLTLRTLLAYMDNTLESQDAEILRQKLAESGFATQLVNRMRETLSSGSITAPSPEAIGPVEEANVISEYLDSTLPAEQVAEIERACLESDPHLAEAAACHQILTMIMGRTAVVSSELRQRVYELPDRKLEDIAAARSFSAVSIPAAQPLQPIEGPPTTDVTAAPQKPVTPVGVNDSGVSDAPTRLRQAEASRRASGARGQTAMAGSKPRSVDDARIYGGSIRPSRIAPWLVSFALAAVLLFALVQSFRPIWESKQVAEETPKGISTDSLTEPSQQDTEVAAEEATPMVDVDSDAAESVESIDDVEMLPPPEPLTSPEATAKVDDVAVQQADSIPEPAPAEDSVAADSTPSDLVPAESSAVIEVAADTPTADVAEDVAPPMPAVATDSTPPAAIDVVETVAPPVPPAAADVAEGESAEIATVTSDATLLVGLVGEQWVRLNKDAKIGQGQKIICAPTFRAQMSVPGASITLVGPAQVEWVVDDGDAAVLVIEFGRVLVTATEADASLAVQLGDQSVNLGFADLETVAAASVQHFRAPGFDPLVPGNRRLLAGLYAVQGALEVTVDGEQNQLATGQQWVKRGSADAEVTAAESAPTWIDAADPSETDLEVSAREGLLELIREEQPLEIALREATQFRRSEVAALAGQTLLHVGLGDVYFGGDGILSEPKQRSYWPDHFVTLVATADRSAESAQKLRQSMVNMDSANALPLFRLLTGYSQKQLVEGGDEELVQLLDSQSMAVRVLAFENLRKIAGATLNFRAEQENAVRRAPVIKKWVARLRKGDIRWQQ